MKKTEECNYETDSNQGPRALVNLTARGGTDPEPVVVDAIGASSTTQVLERG